jgi:small subunit ribosomal protein S9
MNLPNLENNKEGTQKIKLDFKDSKYATGRRKRSVAKVWIKKGSGKIFVNGKEMIQYFKRPTHQIIVTKPLEEINVMSQYDVKCNVKGGGLSGQAGAIIHGMSRALVNMDNSLKKILKKNKFTTRDSRKVERKKYGHRKARRSFQFSKR